MLKTIPESMTLSIGVVNGRNIWSNDFADSLKLLETALQKLGPERLMISPSCSLLHVPVTLKAEAKLDEELRGWLAFAEEKLEETVTLARLLEGTANPDILAKNQKMARNRRKSSRVHDPNVKKRCGEVVKAS